MEKRAGILWEGRYKSRLVSANEYLLACCRDVELNPVQAGIVADPSEYCWPSYGSNIGDRSMNNGGWIRSMLSGFGGLSTGTVKEIF